MHVRQLAVSPGLAPVLQVLQWEFAGQVVDGTAHEPHAVHAYASGVLCFMPMSALDGLPWLWKIATVPAVPLRLSIDLERRNLMLTGEPSVHCHAPLPFDRRPIKMGPE